MLHASLLLLLSAHGAQEPVPPPPFVFVYPTRDEIERQREAALAKVRLSKELVRKMFWTGPSDHHYGYPLSSERDGTHAGDISTYVWPDFSEAALAQFDAFFMKADDTYVGKAAVCDCVGTPWTFRGEQHFFVRSAKLSLVD